MTQFDELLSRNRIIRRVLNGFTVFYVALLFMFFLVISFSWENIVISLSIIGIRMIRHHRLPPEKLNKLVSYLLPLIEFLLIIKLFYGTQTEIENIILVIYTVDLIAFNKFWFGISFSFIGYIVYLVLWGEYKGDLIGLLISVLGYSFLIASIWGAKVLLLQRETILQLNKKILEQSSAMEDLAKLKERNLIAEEVHNTVGHKLTTSIVALEGAHLLFDKKPKEAHEKLDVARKQLKEGLSDIREVVRALKGNDDLKSEKSLKTSIERIIHDVQLQTGIKINLTYQLEQAILPLQEYVLFNAIKEGITNALKHANPQNMDISLTKGQYQVELIIGNDGQGCESVLEGFGLKSMKANVEAIGGKMEVVCLKRGLTLLVYIPIVEE